MSSGDDRGSLQGKRGWAEREKRTLKAAGSHEQIYVVDDKIIFCVLACFVSKAKNVRSSHTPSGPAKNMLQHFF